MFWSRLRLDICSFEIYLLQLTLCPMFAHISRRWGSKEPFSKKCPALQTVGMKAGSKLFPVRVGFLHCQLGDLQNDSCTFANRNQVNCNML